MNTEVVPVTQAEMTKTEVEYSLKIGKQVIKKQLTSAIEKLEEEFDTIGQEISKKFQSINLYNFLHDEAKQKFEADEDVAKIVDAINMFTVDETPFTIFDLYNGDNSTGILERFRSLYYHTPQERIDLIKQTIDEKVVMVTVDMTVTSPNTEYRDGKFLCVSYEIGLPKPIVETLKEIHDLYVRSRESTNEANKLRMKLNNIDSTMEEIEATLLVNELRSSDSGNKVLAAASGIISEVLGETPSLLQLNQ